MNKRKWDVIFSIIAFAIVLIMIVDLLPCRSRKNNKTNVTPNEIVTEEETEFETERETIAEETTAETESETTLETEPETETETEEITEAPTEIVTELPTELVTAPSFVEIDTKPEVTIINQKYMVKIEKTNSWESDGKVFAQYSCKVTNNSDVELNGWDFTEKIGTGYEISSSWNGTFKIENGVLTIKPEGWNATVGANMTIETCGFIMYGPKIIDEIKHEGGNLIAVGPVNPGITEQPTNPVINEKPYTPPKLESGTPLANHGKLSVNGVNLVDKNGNGYQLKGPSTHGLQWFPQYVDKRTFKYIRDNWGANMIRLAMYTAEGGYCAGSAEKMEATVDKGVKAATELGMYVIIDWHILSDGNPNTNKAQAKVFFAKMAKRYSSYTNVIYEICNEPNGASWADVKQYADEIIPIIRQYNKDAIIICGTPTWSQDVDQVALNPLKKENQKNVMYAVHFYAATHGQYLRDKVVAALAAGTPIFVSEFSICDASGNGGIDYTSAEEWKKLIKKYNLSFAGWSLSNKGETSALIKSDVTKTTDWTTEDLSDTGKWLRQFISE